jgi:hypothetical protein
MHDPVQYVQLSLGLVLFMTLVLGFALGILVRMFIEAISIPTKKDDE